MTFDPLNVEYKNHLLNYAGKSILSDEFDYEKHFTEKAGATGAESDGQSNKLDFFEPVQSINEKSNNSCPDVSGAVAESKQFLIWMMCMIMTRLKSMTQFKNVWSFSLF